MFVFGFMFLRWHNISAHANNVKLIRKLEKLPKSQKPKVPIIGHHTAYCPLLRTSNFDVYFSHVMTMFALHLPTNRNPYAIWRFR